MADRSVAWVRGRDMLLAISSPEMLSADEACSVDATDTWTQEKKFKPIETIIM